MRVRLIVLTVHSMRHVHQLADNARAVFSCQLQHIDIRLLNKMFPRDDNAPR